MNIQEFDQYAAGAKTYWMIKFKKPNEHQKLSFDLYLPNLANGGKTLIRAGDDVELHSAKSYEQLQKICAHLKNQCMKCKNELDSKVSLNGMHETESNKTDQAIANFLNLLTIFQWIMKQLRPPGEDNNPEEKKRENEI